MSLFLHTAITRIFRNYSSSNTLYTSISYIMHKDKLFPLKVNPTLPSYLKDITGLSGNTKRTPNNILLGHLINNHPISPVKKYRNGNARYPTSMSIFRGSSS